ncbi:MAG: hypothetical protein JSS95_08565 [Acidobacteria bacterium]|nr:hypothetical protein [Acidobacteriota bacterium]
MNPTQSPDRNDHQIDCVLNALRDATPPTGMDRRILNILEAHSLSKSVIPSEATKSHSRGIPAFRNARTAALVQWTAAAIAALVIAAIFTFTSHRRTTSPTTATTTHTTPAPAQPVTTIIHTTPHSTTTAHANVKLTQPQPAEATEPAEDAQLSHPAPPIPITDQERILLRYTSHGRTEDLAQISNEHTAAKEQKEAADFQAFFTPPEILTGESE